MNFFKRETISIFNGKSEFLSKLISIYDVFIAANGSTNNTFSFIHIPFYSRVKDAVLIVLHFDMIEEHKSNHQEGIPMQVIGILKQMKKEVRKVRLFHRILIDLL